MSSSKRGSRTGLRRKGKGHRGSKGSSTTSGTDIDALLDVSPSATPKRVSLSLPGKKRMGKRHSKQTSQEVMDGTGFQRSGAPSTTGGEGHGGRFKDHKHGLRHATSSPGPKQRTASFTKLKTKKAWKAMRDSIRSICKFHRAMKDPTTRRQFEDYLILQINTGKDIRRASVAALSQHTSASSGRQMSIFPGHRSGKEHTDEADTTVMRRRVVGNRSIVANFLINDLFFYLEMQKFFSMTDAADVLMSYGMYQEADEARLRWKINMIIKQFLQADTLPKFRVNITDAQKDTIIQQASQGFVERSLFHAAMISIFPLLMTFWKRFCHKKAMDTYYNYRQEKKSVVASQVPDTHPQEVWKKIRTLGPDEYPILRFTLASGLQLILPREDEMKSVKHGLMNVASLQKNLSVVKSGALSDGASRSQASSPPEQKHLATASVESVSVASVREPGLH